MHLFITGVNGFIGNWLVRYLLATTDWTMTGIDLYDTALTPSLDTPLGNPRFTFHKGDMTHEKAWVEEQIKAADVVIPLAAIANPALYVSDPLRVFELDFEANLNLIKLCVKHKKRLLFPSTSEVYGMSQDAIFDEESSPLTVGPTRTSRWIYSASKQLLDRVLHGYGDRDGLDYTLFRPFNWIGPRLDTTDITRPGTYRAFTQFISNAVLGKPLSIVGSGTQRRAFIFILDALEALRRMIENKGGIASGKIYNVGNPANELSVNEVASTILEAVRSYPLPLHKAQESTLTSVHAFDHFGKSYQDVDRRVPSITRAHKDLGWEPHTSFNDALKATLDFYLLHKPLDFAP